VVTISNVFPTADAGGLYTTTVGVPVTLTGSGADVPADPLTYTWNLDNDSIFETPGRIVTFTRATTGTYPVTLQVDDGDGGIVTDTTTVQVNSLLPFAWLGSPYFLALRRRKNRQNNRSNQLR
jgi:hypothetical protein